MAKGPGGTLPFPTAPRAAPVAPPPLLRPAIVMEEIPKAEAQELLRLVALRIKQAEDLLAFVDRRRAEARKAGVETIAIELSAVLEGGKLERAYDALEEAVQKGQDAHLTRDSLDRIRRFETLISDAARNLGQVPLTELSAPLGRRLLGDAYVPAPAQSVIPSALIWGPIAFFGVVVLSISVVWLLSPKDAPKTKTA